VGLKDAREKAADLRKVARQGKDPTARRVTTLTFREAAEKVHEQRKATWRNGKHCDQWINTLKAEAFPKIGRKAVGELEPADVLNVLTPIWLKKPETARRVRQRIGTVLYWATTAGYRSPLAVNAAHAVRAALPKQKQRVKHQPALPWAVVPEFIRGVRHCASQEGARLALEFRTLTAARTTEVIEGTRSEVDLDAKVWTVPAGRMKGEREHRVPLSDQAVAVLTAAFARWPDSRLLFCGRYPKKPLSNQAMLMLMRRMGLKATCGRIAVPHGLRSSFRDWVADTRRQDRDLAEVALSHVLDSKVEAAYQRSDILEQRRELMLAWANYCTKPAAGKDAEPPAAQAELAA
jgi:integrase